jgi:hypothetical protein
LDRPVGQPIEEQNLSPLWLAVVRFGPALIVAAFYVAVVLHYAYTPDDTYIYLQYAKNLANGNGFSFNAGSPSYGVTGPLWVLLIAAGARAGLDPFLVAKTFDILFASLSIVLVYTISVTIIRDRIFALFGSLVFASDAWFLRWSGTGMETSFAVVLVLLTVKYAYSGDYHIAGFVAGLLTLVRPEGFLLFVVVQLESFIVAFVLGRERNLFWIAAILYFVVVVPWLSFSYIHFGTLIPNTEFAKSAVQWSFRDLLTTLFDSIVILCSTQPLLVLMLFAGFPFVIRRGGIGTLVAKGMPVLWIVGLVLAYAVLNVQVVSRYLVPLIPLIAIYALWCLKQTALAYHWSFKRSISVAAVLVAVTVIQSQVVYAVSVVPHMREFAVGMEQGIKPIAVWLRSNTAANASVLTPDVGMIGYISERRLFDTAGLITPAVKRSFEGASYDEGMNRHLYRKVLNPDYVVDRATVAERLASDSLRPIMTTQFASLGMKKVEPVHYTLYMVIQ